ncbi:MAG TPA: phosphatase PAP2 family protein [Actinotalea sp.]
MTAPPSFPPPRTGDGTVTGGRGPAEVVAGPASSPLGASVRIRHGHWAPALAVALVAAVAVWLTWRLFVVSPTGRLVDEAAFKGASYGRNRLWQVAEPVLSLISVPFIAGVLLAAILLAVLRGRVLLAVQVAVLMGGANLTTQLLKTFVFDRPAVGVTDHLANSLPSGHTTAAASVACALVLVVPRRVRPTAAVLGALYTAATGVSTLVGRWHRPSDAVAGVLVVLVWAGLASALGTRGGVVRPRELRRSTSVVTAFLLLAGAFAGGLAAVALQRTLARVGVSLDHVRALVTAYAGGALGVVAVTCATFAVLLLLRRWTEPRLV